MKTSLKIFEQTFWQVLGKIVTTISTFIILGLVARNYGQAGTGVFTLTLTYLAIFYLLADFGANAHVLKNLKSQMSNVKFEWRKLLGTRIIWSVFLIIMAVGLLPFLPFANQQFSQSVWFGVLAILGSAVFVTCNLIFQNYLRYDLSVLASSLGTIVSLVIFILIIKNNFPVPFLLLAHLTSWLLIALTALVLVKKFVKNIIPLLSSGYTTALLKQSWPIAATLSLNVLYFRIDSFLIAYFKNISDVGVYNVAYSVFQSALVLPTFIMNAYYPLMLKSLSKVKLMALGLLGLSLIGTLFILYFAPLVIKILTGEGFSGSETSLQILSLGFPAYFLSALLMWILMAKNKYKSMLLLYTSGTLLNIILNLLFIPKYSYLAASWTTVISEYFILALQVMVLWFGRRRE